jgi:hypothetical protein
VFGAKGSICFLSECLMKYFYDISICDVFRLDNLDVLLHPAVYFYCQVFCSAFDMFDILSTKNI